MRGHIGDCIGSVTGAIMGDARSFRLQLIWDWSGTALVVVEAFTLPAFVH